MVCVNLEENIDLTLNLVVTTNGSLTVTKSYYLATALQADWVTAYDFCKGCGMDLVSLDNLAEADNFLNLCKKNAASFLYGYQAFIGGLAPSVGADFQWFESGNKVSFQLKWAKNEPTGNYQNCLVVVPKTGKFADLECFGLSYNFVCQETRGKSAGNTTPSAAIGGITKKIR